MGSCKNCGTAIPEGATNCPTCGTAVDSQPAQLGQQPGSQPPQAEKKKKHRVLKVVIIVIVLLVVLGAISQCGSGGGKTEDEKTYDWPTGTLAQMLPTMEHDCDYVFESEDSLSIGVEDGVTRDEYNTYVSECKDCGFTVDATETSDNYEAYNDEGYRLQLSFYDFSDTSMDISLDAPKTNGTLTWPTTGLAAKLPNPNKEKGSVENDSTNMFSAYVGGVRTDEYTAYVEACMEAGFTENYDKSDDLYTAENSEGDSLWVEYQGSKIMYIELYAADNSDVAEGAAQEESGESVNSSTATENQATQKSAKDDASEKASASNENKSKKKSSSSGKTDHMKAMDEYEKFMDGYIDFMEKYSESDDVASMLADYTEWMADYSDMCEKFAALEDEELTDEELAYYVDVQARVSKKLIEAGV